MFSFIPGIGQILVLISGAKWFWQVVNNWGTIKNILGDVETVCQGMLKRKGGAPTREEVRLLLDAAKLLFEKDLIDLPMVDEADLARILGNIENNIIVNQPEVKNEKRSITS